jgi:hypothetical protein
VQDVHPEAERSRHSSSTSSAEESSPSRQQQQQLQKAQLPPDAIDLVVEDVEAAEDEMTRKRRKGEPAVAIGEGKIYRREYVVRDPAGSASVKDVQMTVEEEEEEEEEEGVEDPGRLGEERAVATTEVRAEENTSHGQGRAREETDGGHEAGGARGGAISEVDDVVPEIVRLATPPPHAQTFVVSSPRLRDVGDDDEHSNPWA